MCFLELFASVWFSLPLDFVVSIFQKVQHCQFSGSPENKCDVKCLQCYAVLNLRSAAVLPLRTLLTKNPHFFLQKNRIISTQLFSTLHFPPFRFSPLPDPIKQRKGFPLPACTNDLHIERRLGRGKSGQHLKKAGSGLAFGSFCSEVFEIPEGKK